MKRRVLGMLAAAALGLTAVVGVAPAATAEPAVGVPYVAFGDSEAAGTGNLPYVDQDCMRSRKSYPLLLGGASYACSGATSLSVLTEQIPAAILSGSLGTGTTAVTVTVGVNDVVFTLPGPVQVGWQDLLAYCAEAGDGPCAAALLTADTSGLANLVLALGLIRATAPIATIYVTGYPDLFGDVVKPCSIGMGVKVTPGQAALADDGIAGLNFAIAAAAAAVPGTQFVPLTDTFAGHGLCGTGDRWISGLLPDTAKTYDRSLHITSPGQRAIAEFIG